METDFQSHLDRLRIGKRDFAYRRDVDKFVDLMFPPINMRRFASADDQSKRESQAFRNAAKLAVYKPIVQIEK